MHLRFFLAALVGALVACVISGVLFLIWPDCKNGIPNWYMTPIWQIEQGTAQLFPKKYVQEIRFLCYQTSFLKWLSESASRDASCGAFLGTSFICLHDFLKS